MVFLLIFALSRSTKTAIFSTFARDLDGARFVVVAVLVAMVKHYQFFIYASKKNSPLPGEGVDAAGRRGSLKRGV